MAADAQRHQSPCSDRRPDGRRKNEMKDRQACQSEAEARLSVESAIAVSAITISLKSSLSAAWSHRREEPLAEALAFRQHLASFDKYLRGSFSPNIDEVFALNERAFRFPPLEVRNSISAMRNHHFRPANADQKIEWLCHWFGIRTFLR